MWVLKPHQLRTTGYREPFLLAVASMIFVAADIFLF